MCKIALPLIKGCAAGRQLESRFATLFLSPLFQVLTVRCAPGGGAGAQDKSRSSLFLLLERRLGEEDAWEKAAAWTENDRSTKAKEMLVEGRGKTSEVDRSGQRNLRGN